MAARVSSLKICTFWVCLFPLIPWRKCDPKAPLLEGTFGDKFWRPLRSRALLFTPDRQSPRKIPSEWVGQFSTSRAKLYTPPSPPPVLAKRHFPGGGGGGVYFETPRGRNFIPPPLFKHPPPLGGYFQGFRGGVYKKSGNSALFHYQHLRRIGMRDLFILASGLAKSGWQKGVALIVLTCSENILEEIGTNWVTVRLQKSTVGGSPGPKMARLFRSRPGKPNQRKGQNEKFMNFAHFCKFCCFSLGEQARFTLNFCSGMPLREGVNRENLTVKKLISITRFVFFFTVYVPYKPWKIGVNRKKKDRHQKSTIFSPLVFHRLRLLGYCQAPKEYGWRFPGAKNCSSLQNWQFLLFLGSDFLLEIQFLAIFGQYSFQQYLFGSLHYWSQKKCTYNFSFPELIPNCMHKRLHK